MSSVIFIITIPTAEEEQRLKNVYIARKLDLNCDEHTNEVLPQQTTTSDTKFSHSTHQTGAEKTQLNAVGVQIPRTSTEITSNRNSSGYGTFPKEPKNNTSDCKLTTNPSASNLKNTTENENFSASQVMRKSFDGLREILSSAKGRYTKKINTDDDQYINEDGIDNDNDELDINLPSSTCMEIVLREILKVYEVLNATWTKDAEGRMYQIIFTCEFNTRYEDILDKLYKWGIGEREGSTISVVNCVASKTHIGGNDADNVNNDLKARNLNARKQSVWERFMNTMRSRLNVAQIIRDVRQDASITFDFLILLISAAILASLGLVEDSTIFLASSMLISPLMGPIIAGIFGTVIKDHSLTLLGLKNELLGILLATLVGFVFGVILCSVDDVYGIGDGLTNEMLSRCDLHSLIVGILIAIPSGAAAAIGILGGNIGSLVGVAISASLLPPAVNSGLLWALACIYKYYEADNTRYNNVVKTHLYSNNQTTELAILGSISMCLTISNVLCVYIMGILVLKVKEIAPVISRRNRQFWTHDIKIARDLSKKGDHTNTNEAIIDEIANLPKDDQKLLGYNCDFLRNIHLDDDDNCQNTWSPIGNFYKNYDYDNEKISRNPYTTIHHLERLYLTNSKQVTQNEKRKRRYTFTARSTETISEEIEKSSKLLNEKPNRRQILQSSAVSPVSSNPNRFTQEDKKTRKFIITPVIDACTNLEKPDEKK